MTYETVADTDVFDTPAPEVDRTAVSIRRSIASVETSLTEFEKISAGLEVLRKEHPVDLVFDVTTTKGMAEAVAHRAAWRDPRITVEKFRKAAKAPVLTLGKDIDARAAWLTEQLMLGETPVHEQIKSEEARKAQERADREAKEFGRIVAIQEAISDYAMIAMVTGRPSAEIAMRLDSLKESQPAQVVFQEMMPQAQEARLAAIAKLEQALKAAQWDEAEAKRKADEAEAARVKRAEEDAERARVSAAQAAESKRLQEARDMIAKAEKEAADKIAAERAEFERDRNALAAERAQHLRDIEAAKPAPVVEAAPAKPVIAVVLEDVKPFEIPKTEDPTLSLGEIKDRLAPLQITAEGLTQLGFAWAASKGPTRLYLPSKWPAMKAAIVAHVEALA